jgi:hypothetical protein
MQNILDVHQALRRPFTSKVNYAEAQIIQGKLREPVKKNDLLIGQKRFSEFQWQRSTRVQDTDATMPQAYFDVYSPTKIIEFNGELWAFRGQRGGAGYIPSSPRPQTLGTVYRYNLATDTWTAVYNIPGRWEADRGTAIDAVVFQGTLWFGIGAQDDTSRNDNFVGIYRWTGTTFVLQVDLDGTPTNTNGAQHVFDLSMVVYNERLFIATASAFGSRLTAYNGQTWTLVSDNAPNGTAQRTVKLVVFGNDLYWLQGNSTNNLIYVSRYLRNDNPTPTNYQWQFNERSFDAGRTNFSSMDVIVHNNTVFIALTTDHHTQVFYSGNMYDYYVLYSTGNGWKRRAEDYKDPLNTQWKVRWLKTSDNDLYMVLGGTADRLQFYRIHDNLDIESKLGTNERYGIVWVDKSMDTGPDLYNFDFIEYEGYLFVTLGVADDVHQFYRIPYSVTNNNENIFWTPAFQYTRNDDYEVNHTEQEYSWMQQKPRGVYFQVHDGDLYKAMTTVYYPYLITWKLVNNKWQKIADPDILPYSDVRTCTMEVYDGNLYLAVANWGGTPRTLTYVWTGVAWSKLIDIDPIDTNNIYAELKTFGNRLYLATANWTAGNRIRTYYFDGAVWVHMGDLPSRPNNEMRMLSMEVHNNQLYLAAAAWNSSFDVYLYRLNTDLTTWTSLTGNIPTQPNNECSAIDLISFNGNLYMAANSNVNSRIYKWDGTNMQLMSTPVNWSNASSDRRTLKFLVHENRLFLIRGDNGQDPYFRMYSLIDEANGVWKSHNRWRPSSGIRMGGYASVQLDAIVYEGEAFFSYVTDADNHRPGMQDLKIAPPGLVKVHPRQDIENLYAIGLALADGVRDDVINIVSFTPDYELTKNNGWEQMVWQSTGA